ncbi:pyruvate kinase [Mycoplasma ovis str. Michigan]|uniref:Pyruvate kinase n=1 Tax=Mycoplasma ovis str. Michigan TaxID=1415773 RepID=A0ABN4BQ05_9MOLU|nr:pyruvate kinase [Mycoplasma ovis]AHC39934.1 pyruvate kinase [Mycoplasma ovis str. Michigan]
MSNFKLGCTKIVATIGPSITLKLHTNSQRDRSNPDYLEVLNLFTELFFKGLSCIRFNFSHSNNEERLFRLQLWREAKAEFYRIFNRIDDQGNSPYKFKFLFPIAELADTKGPEIRVWDMQDKSKGQLYKRGDIVKIYCKDKKAGDQNCFSVTDSTAKYNMALDCSVGSKILVDDGKLSFLIQSVDVDSGVVVAMAENDHFLKGNKRVNLPNADYSLPFVSERDRGDILFSLEQGFQFIALSFVNKLEDILEVKKLIKENSSGKNLPLIISKIETTQCLKNIDSVISESHGIMIARGDLALESPYYLVPYWTKEILRKTAREKKPAIVATQMLDSLERNVVPTRAEVSDVYRAAELTADCTMLSGETAQGLFPLIAVSTMSEVIKAAEKQGNYEKIFKHFYRENKSDRLKSLGDQLFLEINKFSSVVSCFLFSDELLEEELNQLSSLKLPFPFVVFYRKSNYQEAEGDFELKCSALNRGVYKIALVGSKDESLEDCSKAFLHLCGYSSSGNLVAFYKAKNIQLVNL